MNLIWSTLASGLISAVTAAILGAAVLLYIDWRENNRARTEALALCRIVYVEVVSNLVVIRESARHGLAPPAMSVSAWGSHAGRIANLLDEEGLAHVASAYLLVEMHREFFRQGGLDLLAPRLRGLDSEMLDRLATSFVKAEQILGNTCWSRDHRREFSESLVGYLEPTPRRRLSNRIRAALGGFGTEASVRLLAFMLLMWELSRISDALERLAHSRIAEQPLDSNR